MTIDSSTFRAAMRAWASGVAVVTTGDGRRQAGLTVSAFTSLSLSPPLILVCIDRRSSSLALIQQAGMFAVNMLAEDQADLSQRFASRLDDDKFATARWHYEMTSAPILDTALAWLDCQLHTTYEGGDHLILVGRVLAASADLSLGPLLYHGGAYQQLEKAALSY